MIDYAKIDTTISIGGFAIHQPVTAFTDIIISVLCFYFFMKLKRIPTDEKSTKNWKWFYFFLSMASFAGGCSHGLFLIHEGITYDACWRTMQLLNVISVFFAQQATLHSALQNSENKRQWQISYIIQVVLFSTAVFVFHNFLVVIINSIIGLIPIMIIHFKDAKKTKGSEKIAWGIFILFLTAIVNGTKLSFNEYFTYLDIAHVLIIANLSVMYAGIKQKAIS